MNDNLKVLYDKLNSGGIKVPDYNTFQQRYSSEDGLKDLHNKLSSADILVPDFNTFKSKYGAAPVIPTDNNNTLNSFKGGLLDSQSPVAKSSYKPVDNKLNPYDAKHVAFVSDPALGISVPVIAAGKDFDNPIDVAQAIVQGVDPYRQDIDPYTQDKISKLNSNITNIHEITDDQLKGQKDAQLTAVNNYFDSEEQRLRNLIISQPGKQVQVSPKVTKTQYSPESQKIIDDSNRELNDLLASKTTFLASLNNAYSGVNQIRKNPVQRSDFMTNQNLTNHTSDDFVKSLFDEGVAVTFPMNDDRQDLYRDAANSKRNWYSAGGSMWDKAKSDLYIARGDDRMLHSLEQQKIYKNAIDAEKPLNNNYIKELDDQKDELTKQAAEIDAALKEMSDAFAKDPRVRTHENNSQIYADALEQKGQIDGLLSEVNAKRQRIAERNNALDKFEGEFLGDYNDFNKKVKQFDSNYKSRVQGWKALYGVPVNTGIDLADWAYGKAVGIDDLANMIDIASSSQDARTKAIRAIEVKTSDDAFKKVAGLYTSDVDSRTQFAERDQVTGGISYNFSALPFHMVKTYAESLIMGYPARLGGTAATSVLGQAEGYGAKAMLQRAATKGAEFSGMNLGAALIFGNQIFKNEFEKTGNFDSAFKIAGGRLMLESLSELINPLEINLAGKQTESLLTRMASQEGLELVSSSRSLALKNFFRDKVGSRYFDDAIDALMNPKLFAKVWAREGSKEYLEEFFSNVGNFAIDKYVAKNIDKDYSQDSELSLENEYLTAINTVLGMGLMGGSAFIRENKTLHDSANYLVGTNATTHLQKLAEDLNLGKIDKPVYDRISKEIGRLKTISDMSSVDYEDIASHTQEQLDTNTKFTAEEKAVATEKINSFGDNAKFLIFLNNEKILDNQNQIVNLSKNLTANISQKRIDSYTEKISKLGEEANNLLIDNGNIADSVKKSISSYINTVKNFPQLFRSEEKVEPTVPEEVATQPDIEQPANEPVVDNSTTETVQDENVNDYQYLKNLVDSGSSFISQDELDSLDDIQVSEKAAEYRTNVANQNKQLSDELQSIRGIKSQEERLDKLSELELSYAADGNTEMAGKVAQAIADENKTKNTVEFLDKTFNVGDRVSYQGAEYYINKDSDGNLILSTKKKLDAENNTTVRPKTVDVSDLREVDVTAPTPNTEITETVDEAIEDPVTEETKDKSIKDDYGLKINITPKITALWSSVQEKFIIINSKDRIITSANQLKQYAQKLTEKPNVVNTWWNELLSEESKRGVVSYFNEYLRVGAQANIESSITLDTLLMSLIRGVKFKPGQVEKNTTDISTKAWISDNGTSLDTLVKDFILGELEANGFTGYSESEVIDMIYSLINSYPSGISKANLEEAMDSDNPARELLALEESFNQAFGLDIHGVVYRLSEDLQNLNLQQYETEKNPSEGQPEDTGNTQQNEEVVEEVKPSPAPEVTKEEVVKQEGLIENPVNPFRSIESGITSKNGAVDIVKKVWRNTINSIAQKSNKTNPLEQGFTVSVVPSQDIPFNNLPSDTRDYFTKDGKEDTTKRALDKGRFIVITDKSGNFLYFNEQGEVTSKDKGLLAINTLPATEKGTLKKQSFNVSDERLSLAGRTREWFNSQVAKLDAARNSNSKTTFLIDHITTGTYKSNSSTPKSLGELVGKEDVTLVVDGKKISLKFNNNKPSVFVRAPRLTREQAISFANTLISVSLNKPRYPGLPEDLNTLEARFNYVKQFLLTGLNYYHQINGQKVYIDFKTGGNGVKAGVYAKVDNGEFQLLPYDRVVDLFSNISFNVNKTNKGLTLYNFNNETKSFEPTVYNTYTDFVIDKFETYTQSTSPIEVNNQFLEIGDQIDTLPGEIQVAAEETKQEPSVVEELIPETEVIKESITTESPVEESKKPTKKRKKFDLDGDFDLGSVLKRALSLKTYTTPAQEAEAERWFKSSPIGKLVNFRDFRNIMNSDARATWTQSAITLWKAGNFTDLYHESWHEFSQLYLTKEQKEALYDEVRSIVSRLKNASDFDVEEYIAEDFRNYVLSEQKLVLDRRPKRNSIFRKIYNFLKEWLTGNTDVQTYYERLYTGNISRYQRNRNNALFGSLNKGLEGIVDEQARTLSNKETKDLYRAIDAVMGNIFEKSGKPITLMFEDNEVLSKVYSGTNNYFKSIYNKITDAIEAKEKEIANTSDPELQAQIQSQLDNYEYILSNLDFVLQNWNTVIKNHSRYSNYFSIATDKVKFDSEGNIIDDLDELDEESDENNSRDATVVKNENGTFSKEAASNETLYLIASLIRKDRFGDTVENDFLPFVDDIVDFANTWDTLSQNLSGVMDYDSMIDKIKELSNKFPHFKDLIQRLPSKSKLGQDLTDSELRLRNAFINDLSKPTVFVYEAILTPETFGLRVNYVKAAATSQAKLRDTFAANFVASSTNDNPYIIQDEDGNNYLNTALLEADYKPVFNASKKALEAMDANSVFESRLEFLVAIGFQFSEETIESEDFKNFVSKFNSPVTEVFKKVLELQTSLDKRNAKIYAPVKELWSQNKFGYTGAWTPIGKILNEELKYSEDLFSQSAKNAEQNSVWQIRQWNYIAKIYSYLNNRDLYPNYQSLQNEPFIKQLDLDHNPYVNGLFLNTIFDLDKNSPNYGARRKDRNGNYPVIELQDYNGLRLSAGVGTNEGKTTTGLTGFEKLAQNINTLLLKGVQEHLRYGDKSSAFGTLMSHIYNPVTRSLDARSIIAPIYQFANEDGDIVAMPPIVEESLIRYLRDELISMHRADITKNEKGDLVVNGIGKDWKYFRDNIKELGLFEGILSDSKSKVIDIALDKTISEEQIIERLYAMRTDLAKDFNKYLKNRTKALTKEFNEVGSLLSARNYLSSDLLKEGSVEQIKAAYVANSLLYNIEHTKLITGDPRFYKAKGGKKDPFKRFSQYSATGNLFVVDNQTNNYIANKGRAIREALISIGTSIPSKTSDGTISSVIFRDNDYASQLFERYKDYYVNKLGYPVEKASKILKAYQGINEADGQGFVTLDELRESKLRAGSSHWTKAHEAAYQKEADFLAGRSQTGMSPEEVALFVPQKWQYSGIGLDKNGYPVPTFYKFSVVPLIPSAIAGTSFEAIHNNLIRQNVGLALFESGSKHSAVTDNSGKFNPFYGNYETRTPFEGDYTINTVFYHYLKEQVNVEPQLKNKVTFSTQMRKLLHLNLFSNGVPLGFKGSFSDWNKLSKEEKKKESYIYKLEQDFADVVENLVNLEKNNVIEKMGATWNEAKQSYDLNSEKLAAFLKQEFIRRELPDEAIDFLQTNADGKFTNPLDAATQRDKIEKTAMAVANKKLIQQKISGEALIQVASTGFELNDIKLRGATQEELDTYGFRTTDLGGYIPEGRTLSDGTKVTSASKIKISFAKKWRPLLKLTHTDGKKIETLERLNEVIKDENWLDLADNRRMITLVGVRIPVQGLNSQEFMEVTHFLPESTGNIIIVHPELVAKSGGDFDIDKLTTFFPNLKESEDGAMLYKPKTEEELKSIYRGLIREFKDRTKKDAAVDKLIESIFGVKAEALDKLEKQEVIEELFNDEKIPSFEQFANLFNKKGYENELIDIVRKTLELNENFAQLVRPNDTDLLLPYAEDLKAKGEKSDTTWTQMVDFKEIMRQFQSNLVGKANLGIAAINNTLFALSQRAGLYMNNTYTHTNSSGRKIKKDTVFHLPHNTVEVDGKEHISLSGLEDSTGEHLISDVISQFINGFVDVAKDDWVFFINGVKEMVPTMLYTTMAGVNNKTMISFFNQPVMKEYIKEIAKYKSLFVNLKDAESFKLATRKALGDIVLNYQKDVTDKQLAQLIKTFEVLTDTYNKIDKKNKDAKSSANFEASMALIKIEEYLSNKAKKESNLFTQETLYNSAFGDTPITAEQSLMVLIHFNELKQQSGYLTTLQRSLNADTKKASSSYSVYDRRQRLKEVYDSGLFPKEPMERMFNESTVRAFTSTKKGFDAFATELFKDLFEITNHPEFNKIIRELISGSKELLFDSKSRNLEKLQNTMKNDFLQYLYQNQVYWEDSFKRVADVVFPLFKSKDSLANQLQDIKSKYQTTEDRIGLTDLYPILNNLIADRAFKANAEDGQKIPDSANIKNIRLKTPIFDVDGINNAVTQIRSLLEFNNPEYSKEEQLEIQNFAKKFVRLAIIQSGLNRSQFYLMEILPSEVYSPDLGPAIKGFRNLLDSNTELARKELKRFYNMFQVNNGSFYDENKGEIYYKKNTVRGKDYRNSSAIDLTGTKTDIIKKQNEEYLEKLPEKVSFSSKRLLDTTLIKANSDKLVVLEANQTNNLQRDLYDKNITNFEAIITGKTVSSSLKDENLKANQEIIDIALAKVINASKRYSGVLLSSSGYGAKLRESAPITYEYLSQQLFETFNFVNPGYQPTLNSDENDLSSPTEFDNLENPFEPCG